MSGLSLTRPGEQPDAISFETPTLLHLFRCPQGSGALDSESRFRLDFLFLDVDLIPIVTEHLRTVASHCC
ncbi:hypothetical protein SLA2020_159390 [Shorea laevis]